MDLNLGRNDYKSGKRFRIGTKRFEIGAGEITDRGMDFKSVQNNIQS